MQSLARKLAQAHQRMVEFYEREEQLPFKEATALVNSYVNKERLDEYKNRNDPSFFTLSQLTRGGEAEAALELWETIKKNAREHLESGFRAAAVIDPYSHANDQARFMALRQMLVEEWQPRGATELMLIDQIAQAQTQYEEWLKRHVWRMNTEGMRDHRIKEIEGNLSPWIPPRQSEAEATREAFEMAEKWQRMLLRTVRALRDLRRYTPPVLIQNANQVNVGQQQVNVSP